MHLPCLPASASSTCKIALQPGHSIRKNMKLPKVQSTHDESLMIVYTAEVGANNGEWLPTAKARACSDVWRTRRLTVEKSRVSANCRASSGVPGIAAWLGWLFDGLDMHLYTLVATPFVAELLVADAAQRRSASATTARGFKPRSWSAGRWAADSSAGSAIGWAAAGR